MTTPGSPGLHNPPPDRCDGCGAGAPRWLTVEGPEATVILDDGRSALRRGPCAVCSACGHTVARSHERLG